MGSVRDFLVENSVEVGSCVKMCWSVASGLAFLHEFRYTCLYILMVSYTQTLSVHGLYIGTYLHCMPV